MSDLIRSLNLATFPTRQVRGPITTSLSTQIQQIGLTVRSTLPNAQSIWLSKAYALKKWRDSPYALRNCEQAKRQESAFKAALIGNAS